MNNKFYIKEITDKLKEAYQSIMPIFLVVIVVSMFVLPVDTGQMLSFLAGTLLMIIGMGLFSQGAEMSMEKIGASIGSKMTQTRNIPIILILSFVIGVAVTMAEPDLEVLAKTVSSIDTRVMILAVSIGVGFFLTIAMTRIIFNISLRLVLVFFYLLIIIGTFFIPQNSIPIAFDAGGVTTGSITVPFVMALGVGISSIRSDANAKSDSFGIVAISSIGPIFTVILLDLIFKIGEANSSSINVAEIVTTFDLRNDYIHEIPNCMKEVSLAILPIFIFFILFQIFSLRLNKDTMGKIMVGIVYTYVGLTLFLTGVNVGFSPLGYLLGTDMVAKNYTFMIIPLSIIMGWFIIKAEPAVKILTKQVEEITSGAISRKMMEKCLSIAIALANGLAMFRVMTGIPIIYFVIPGYLLALILTFFVPREIYGIAFDSGGVASGTLTATFMLPFAIGVCNAIGGNILTDAFGMVAIVAMVPLIVIQVIGLLFTMKKEKQTTSIVETDNEVIELWEI